MSVFEKQSKSHMESLMFFDGGVDIARYDQVRNPALEKITEKMLGFYWRPEEVDVSKDRSDFANLTNFEKHIFTSNLKRQILLYSVQGRGPTETFMSAASVPEIEPMVMAWAFFETIHSRSYTHIIRNVYANPSKIFDDMLDIAEIVDCAKDIAGYYDSFIEYQKWYDLLGEGTHTVNGKKVVVTKYELKKRLWIALNSINILEGVRFYVSFACSWAFAELKKMEGNAKITKEDPDFVKIREECSEQVTDMFVAAVDQEKQWADYLFKDGSMIGLNAKLLSNYIEWIANKRMKTLAVASPYSTPQANPLPWTEKWIGGGNVQVAPQETEISSYVIGGVKQDVSKETFIGMSL